MNMFPDGTLMTLPDAAVALLDVFRDHSKGHYTKAQVEGHIANYLQYCDEKFHRDLKAMNAPFEASLTVPVKMSTIKTLIGNSQSCADLVQNLFGSSRTFRLGPHLLSLIPVVFNVLDRLIAHEVWSFNQGYGAQLFAAFGTKFEQSWPPNMKAFHSGDLITMRCLSKTLSLLTHDNARKVTFTVYPAPSVAAPVLVKNLVAQIKFDCPFDNPPHISMPNSIGNGRGITITMDAGVNVDFIEPNILWSAMNAIHREMFKVIQPFIMIAGGSAPAVPPPGAKWAVYVPHPALGGPGVPWVSSRAIPAPAPAPAAGAPAFHTSNGKGRATDAGSSGKGPAKSVVNKGPSDDEDEDQEYESDWKSDEGEAAKMDESNSDDDDQDD